MFGELEDMLLEASSVSGLPGINVPYYQDPDSQLFWVLTLLLNVARRFSHQSG